MFKRIVAAITLALTTVYASMALAQSVPNGPIVSGQQWTIQEWNNAWASKQDLLPFAPLSPTNNLSDLSNIATARSNLGLGSSATSPLGTSGSVLCLTNSSCTWSGSQTFQQGINTTSITGLSQPLSTAIGGIGTSNGDVSNLTVTSSGTSAASSLASHFARQVWVTDFDANACSSISYDSSAAFNAASQWMLTHGPGVILIPAGNCRIGDATYPSIILGNGVSLKGSGTYSTYLSTTSTNTATIVKINGGGVVVSDLTITANAAGTNTSGTAIQFGQSGTTYMNDYVNNVNITGPCIGIDLDGNTVGIQNAFINAVAGSACGGIRVGLFTTQANTVDAYIRNVTIVSSQTNPGGFGMQYLDLGGGITEGVDILYFSIGTELTPGANQIIQWSNWLGTVLGDTVVNQALYINPGASTSQVVGDRFNSAWMATNSSGDLVTIQNTNSGTIADIDFNHSYFLKTPGNALTIGNNVIGTSITGGSLLCLYSTPNAGVNLQGGAGTVQIVGSKITPSCVGQSGTGTKAINFSGGNDRLVITDNDFAGNSASLPFGNVPTGNDVIIERNASIDNNSVNLTNAAISGTALDLSVGGTANALSPSFTLTSSSGVTISTITNAGWQGRTFRIINATGGSVTIGGGASTGGGVLPNPGKTLVNGDTAWCYYTGAFVTCH